MKRVYIVNHPKGRGRASSTGGALRPYGTRKVVEAKTARVRYRDLKEFKRQCMSLLEAEKGSENVT